MDSKKILILVLVVVAILTLMIIGAGYRRDRNDRNYQQKEEDGPFSGLDGLFAKFRSKFDVGRIDTDGATTCGWDRRKLITASGKCDVKINGGKSASSAFKLQPGSVVLACFAFTADGLKECEDKGKQSALKPNSRFVVGKGEAFLRLFCAVGSCPVELILEE
jgi:hypothetical protein